MILNKILIVIDAQNDFISGALGNPTCEPVVEYIVKKVKEYHDNEEQVIFTYDTHDEAYLYTLEGKKLPVPHCIYRTEGWRIDQRIRSEMNDWEDVDVHKKTFGYIDWKPLLYKAIKDDTVIELVGFDSDICVVSNGLILRASFPNNRIIVDAKGCWGTTKEKHNAALDVMESCQIEIINRN